MKSEGDGDMQNRYLIDPLKFVIALLTAIALILLGAVAWMSNRYVSMAIYFLLGGVFLYVVFIYGSIVTVSERGVVCRFAGITRHSFLWTNISEVGVVGTKVFNRVNPKKTGSLYIYFSPTFMDDKERFDLVMKWPPSKLIFLKYNKKRMDSIQIIWSRKITEYNTGDGLFR